MKLYENEISSSDLRARIALALKGLDVEDTDRYYRGCRNRHAEYPERQSRKVWCQRFDGLLSTGPAGGRPVPG